MLGKMWSRMNHSKDSGGPGRGICLRLSRIGYYGPSSPLALVAFAMASYRKKRDLKGGA